MRQLLLHTRRIPLLICWTLLTISCLAQDQRPNILLIVADDLGYASIEPFAGEVNTPFLAEIAAQSTLFTNFHALPTCSPSRSVMLTGTDNHIVGIGAQKGGISEKQKDLPGYEGHLNFRASTLPEVLRTAGYRTYMTGKWHLGTEEEHSPFRRGFQESFCMVAGGGSHFADQLPLHPEEPMIYRRNGQEVTDLHQDFYSTRDYTDSLLLWLERDKTSDQPFLAYLAYTAPHDPLHAPESYIERYKGMYDEGYEVMRENKFMAMKDAGLIDASTQMPEWPPYIPRWEVLSSEKQQQTIRDMETYAAMIEYMDHQIGRIHEWLAENQLLDNTMIVFISDNGASGLNPHKIYPSYTDEFGSQFDNSMENRGLANSFTFMDAGWAVASTVLYRDFKYSTAEGGIRTPCIIKPPSGLQNGAAICHSFIHISDLMPTMLEVAEANLPDDQLYEVTELAGSSLLPLFSAPELDIHHQKGQGYELHGAKAYIRNGWKIIQSPIPGGSGDWELYNLNHDPGEQRNLIFSHRDTFNALHEAYLAYEKEVGVVNDLPLSFKKIDRMYQVLVWSTVALVSISLMMGWRIGAKQRNRFMKGMMTIVTLAGIAGIAGLFTMGTQYAAYGLLGVLGVQLLLLIIRRAKVKVLMLSVVGCALLGCILVIKSGWLLRFLI